MRIAAGLMMAALLAGCATTAPSAPAPAPKTVSAPKAVTPAPVSGKALVKDSDSKQVCRRQKEIGTNFPTRVCKTAAEWAAYDKANLEGVEQFKRDSMQTTGVSPQ